MSQGLVKSRRASSPWSALILDNLSILTAAGITLTAPPNAKDRVGAARSALDQAHQLPDHR